MSISVKKLSAKLIGTVDTRRRPALHAEERKRKARIRKIRRENFVTVSSRLGGTTLRLKVDHQQFQIGDMGSFTKKEARWTSTQLAIALHRFKYGD